MTTIEDIKTELERRISAFKAGGRHTDLMVTQQQSELCLLTAIEALEQMLDDHDCSYIHDLVAQGILETIREQWVENS